MLLLLPSSFLSFSPHTLSFLLFYIFASLSILSSFVISLISLSFDYFTHSFLFSGCLSFRISPVSDILVLLRASSPHINTQILSFPAVLV